MGIIRHMREMLKGRGFALLTAIIFMGVMLSLGLTLTSLGYKQSILASTASESQYAFYAADAALECTLALDLQTRAIGTANFGRNPFSYETYGNGQDQSFTCGSATVYASTDTGKLNGQRVTSFRIPIAYANPLSPTSGTETRCADVTVSKAQGNPAGGTAIFSQGYDFPCSSLGNANLRIVARALQATY